MFTAQGHSGNWMVVLERGEMLVNKLTQFVSEHEIQGGQITGLGAITDVEIGYYDLETKEYRRNIFGDTDYELISLVGNISLKEDKPFIHVHATMGDMNFKTFGGHLFESKVAVTVEVFITPFGNMPIRKNNSEVGLDLICQWN